MTELPLIFAVDEDAEALERITDELQRYARDYRVVCGPSTEAALGQLEALHEEGGAVAIVLAARGTGELKGEALLERARSPPAREARAAHPVGWMGGRGDGECDQERDGARPHRLLRAEALELAGRALPPSDLGVPAGWRRQNAPGRREITVVADPWSQRGYALRNLLARNGVPHAFHTPDSDEESSSFARALRRVSKCPSSSFPTELHSWIPGPRSSHSTGRACGRRSIIPVRSTW